MIKSALLCLAILIMGASPVIAQTAEKEGRRVYNSRVTGSTPSFVGAQVNQNTSGASPIYLSSQSTYNTGGAPLSINQLIRGAPDAANGSRNFGGQSEFSPYGTTTSKKYALGVSPDEVRRRRAIREKDALERQKIIEEQMRNNNSAYKNPSQEAEQYRASFQNTGGARATQNRTVPKIYVTDRSNIPVPQRTFR